MNRIEILKQASQMRTDKEALECLLPLVLRDYARENPEYMERLNNKIRNSNLKVKKLWDPITELFYTEGKDGNRPYIEE